MRRPAIYALAGGCLGIAFLTAFGAVYGYLYGAGANDQHPPGLQGMVIGSMLWAGFLWPVAGGMGAMAGFGAGLIGAALDVMRGMSGRRCPPEKPPAARPPIGQAIRRRPSDCNRGDFS